MNTFIFIFALIACLMLAQGTPVDETTEGAVTSSPPAAGVELEIPIQGRAVVNTEQCNAIGGHCHRSDDCCTLRCHSYRQRCVS